ncbi:hypothetical protein ES705_36995 [subsurface metagenome]
MKGFKDRIIHNTYLRWILLFSNWLFQGIIHADKTEKIYKIHFTLTFSVGFYFLLKYAFNIPVVWAVLFGFILGHTFNWFANGSFYAILVHRLLISKLNKERLFIYLDKLINRLEEKNFILYCASFGSICRGALKDSSDIDVSLVRKPGFINSFKALYFIFNEKKLADLYGIPLEIFLSDSPENSKKRFGSEHNPVVIYDPENNLNKHYSETLTLANAKKINGIT